MNLNELIGINGLQQDEWSLTAPTFGKDGQIEVCGWGNRGRNGAKLYILKCNSCSQDSELFGEGYFRSLKNGLINGILPCGCGKSPRWSKEQYSILCSRKAKEIGYTFLGFEGEWRGKSTKIKMLCQKHGKWNTSQVNTLVNRGYGCPVCKGENIGRLKVKPDDVIIDSFFASGAFHPDTKFWRSDRENNLGWKPYWKMSCPECGEVGESINGNLKSGKRPCGCSKQRQREAYINLVIDGENTLAIKFGIANNSKERIKKQDHLSAYTLVQYSVYKFPDIVSCKRAEKDCLQELECGIVLKRDLPDGYTETTHIFNLEKIIEIYERNGGVKVD